MSCKSSGPRRFRRIILRPLSRGTKRKRATLLINTQYIEPVKKNTHAGREDEEKYLEYYYYKELSMRCDSDEFDRLIAANKRRKYAGDGKTHLTADIVRWITNFLLKAS
jgi:hypothetical protein